ncbi:glycosyltransferase [Bergeyella zoohelcum]|uniref:glycosyltransferase n=1 Tax=Bergeyella zoohelcum TaxID=1015 RepID=UPI003734F51F
MQPLVTISIPIFKCEDSLEKCLLSVLHQTYKNLEVTLINDQTPDDSVKIAESFIQKHGLQNWKIYYLEENSGLSVVRNKGIDTAQGKYLFFLDSDDTITPSCIEKMVHLAEKEKVQMVMGEVEAVKLPEGKRYPIFPITEKKNTLLNNEEIFESFISGKYPECSWNKLILLDFIKENQLYFTKGLYAQDSLQSFETALVLESIAFLREKTYDYYLHQNSVIHNRGKKHFDNWFTIAKQIDHSFKKEKSPERKKKILQHLINFKTLTLQMNWRAQKNDMLWKESYSNYKTLSSLSLSDYLSPKFSNKIKKENFFNNLPTHLGFKVFKKRWGA